ncbi:MAG: iron-containing alcohol dehydrogenase [Anaerolineaceae bacterium]|nr:iron-containing alcohol dehydrogenase [Anaerolineaceae bacterium]
MREFTDLATYYALDPAEMAQTVLLCPICGREHPIPFGAVRHGKDLLGELPELIVSILGDKPQKIGVIYDRQIEAKLEGLFFQIVDGLGLDYQRIPVGEVGRLLVAEIELGNQIAAQLPPEINLLIGVGSGVITDLTKWIATQVDLPFIIVGTAVSMNAYTSITGSMTENNIKTSKFLNIANAVILDDRLLASAPPEMTAAGVGDLLARDVAQADWKLSQMLRGTYYCPVPYEMMVDYQEKMLPLAEALSHNDIEAMDFLAQADLVSGFSMTIIDGETSPSSGGEHIISHFFDLQHDLYGLPKNLHGTQVGFGTLLTSHAFEMLREMSPADFNVDELVRSRPSLEAWRQEHAEKFGNQAQTFDDNVARKRIPDGDFSAYLTDQLGSWDEIWAALDPLLMPSMEVRHVLEAAGAVTKLSGLSRSEADAIQALIYGSRYRSRYTILDLLWELGLLPDIAPEILQRAGVLD